MALNTGPKVQRWGNSLAVRIPAAVAKTARFRVGQPVVLTVVNANVVVSPVGPAKLSLSQKLARFDRKLHGGEVMLASPIGQEIL